MGVLIDETGNKHGRLTVLERAEKSPSGKLRWKCRCSCGKITTVQGNHLRNGMTRSCGCLQHELLLDRVNGHTLVNNHLRSYQRHAKTRNLPWTLSKKEFYRITTNPCYYCGRPPKSIPSNKWHTPTRSFTGIDRLDNNKGYSTENVVPACHECNSAKSSRSAKDFYWWINRVYTHSYAPNVSHTNFPMKELVLL